jgi:hypothetical protein
VPIQARDVETVSIHPAEFIGMIYKTLLAVHGLFGFVALITYWLAASARKGSLWHRRIGKIYLLSMLGIVLTAAPMAVIIAISGRTGIATFLAYLVVITATGMWLGWRAIKRKSDQAAFRGRAYLIVAILNLVASAATLAIGVRTSQLLLMGFSVVGFIGGAQMLARRARPFASARWWLREHYSAMLGCGVATHIAFLAIGSDRLIRAAGIVPPAWYPMLAWFLPLVVSLFVGMWLSRKYRLRNSDLNPPAPAAQATMGGAT